MFNTSFGPFGISNRNFLIAFYLITISANNNFGRSDYIIAEAKLTNSFFFFSQENKTNKTPIVLSLS